MRAEGYKPQLSPCRWWFQPKKKGILTSLVFLFWVHRESQHQLYSALFGRQRGGGASQVLINVLKSKGLLFTRDIRQGICECDPPPFSLTWGMFPAWFWERHSNALVKEKELIITICQCHLLPVRRKQWNVMGRSAHLGDSPGSFPWLMHPTF